MATFKCLRCGYCCIRPATTIIRTEHVDSKLIVDKTLDYLDKICTKVPSSPCPHLRFDKDGKSTCLVHDKEWFCGTMCYEFNTMPKIQPWFPETLVNNEYECIIGRYVKNNFPPDWWKDWWNWLPQEAHGYIPMEI